MEGLSIVLVGEDVEKEARFDVYHEGAFLAKGQLRSSLPGREFRCSKFLS